MSDAESSSQAYPSLRLTSLTGRLALLYPPPPDTYDSFASLYNDPVTSTYLPPFRAYLSQPLDVPSVDRMLSDHVKDTTRLSFSVHSFSNVHDASLQTSSGPVSHVEVLSKAPSSSPTSSSFAGAFGFTRMATDPETGLRHGELGLLILPCFQSTGMVSAALLALLDLGFAPSLPHSSPDGAKLTSAFGLSLDRIDLSTSTRNASLRYWIEEVLLVQPVKDEVLTESQKSDRESWGEDRLVYYQLPRKLWVNDEDGKRRRDGIERRVRHRAERERAKANG